MKRVAVATYAERPGLAPGEFPLARATAGTVELVPTPWDDTQVDWSTFDAVLLRSCWDYHLRHGEFLDWLDRVEQRGQTILNPPSLVRWNSDKRYLRDLAEGGHRVVETEWIASGDDPALADRLDRRGWQQVVVKPSVSASATDTWQLHRRDADAHDARVRTLTARGAVMMQPFLPEIVERGEWSLVYFDGNFSHAVVKRPAAGEFRVQAEFGGAIRAHEAPGRASFDR